MKTKWNGQDRSGRYQYPIDDINAWDMTIDENGTVYYTSRDEQPKEYVWCPADRLTAHLHKILVQIPAR